MGKQKDKVVKRRGSISVRKSPPRDEFDEIAMEFERDRLGEPLHELDTSNAPDIFELESMVNHRQTRRYGSDEPDDNYGYWFGQV